MKKLFLLLYLATSLAALADDSSLPTIDGNMSDIVPPVENTAKALVAATFENGEIQKELGEQMKLMLDRDKPFRETHREGIDFRISLPEGPGVAFSYSPAAPITAAISVNSLAGATVSVSAEATFNTMWWYEPLWRKGFTPVITVKFSNIHFTGALVDSAVNQQLKQLYGDQFTVKMAGRWLNMGSAMAGFDWIHSSGLHLMLKGGVVGQIGESGGGDNSQGDIKLKGWWGPAAEFGIGGTFKWF